MACSNRVKAVLVKARGFTFIELIITVAIVAVLAAVAFPLGEVVQQRIKEQDLRNALRQIREGLDAYKRAADEGRVKKDIGDSGYPKRLEDLVEGVEDLKDPNKARIYFLRRLPADPMASRPDLPSAQTWGKRSYESPPERPQEGKDVFDVYSLSTRKGLNGVPYNLW